MLSVHGTVRDVRFEYTDSLRTLLLSQLLRIRGHFWVGGNENTTNPSFSMRKALWGQ